MKSNLAAVVLFLTNLFISVKSSLPQLKIRELTRINDISLDIIPNAFINQIRESITIYSYSLDIIPNVFIHYVFDTNEH